MKKNISVQYGTIDLNCSLDLLLFYKNICWRICLTWSRYQVIWNALKQYGTIDLNCSNWVDTVVKNHIWTVRDDLIFVSGLIKLHDIETIVGFLDFETMLKFPYIFQTIFHREVPRLWPSSRLCKGCHVFDSRLLQFSCSMRTNFFLAKMSFFSILRVPWWIPGVYHEKKSLVGVGEDMIS